MMSTGCRFQLIYKVFSPIFLNTSKPCNKKKLIKLVIGAPQLLILSEKNSEEIIISVHLKLSVLFIYEKDWKRDNLFFFSLFFKRKISLHSWKIQSGNETHPSPTLGFSFSSASF